MSLRTYDLIKLNKKLKRHLDGPRYYHTLGVMYTAAALAMAHDCSVEQAQVAGLLHDCAKCISDEKKLRLCEKYNLVVSAYEANNPSLLHAKLGALLAKKRYHVFDTEVLSAISWHTTGKAAMTKLEKIVYIADYIEPGRDKAPHLDEIRRIAFIDLDECIYLIARDTLAYLRDSKKEIDAATESAYEYYCNLHNQN